MAPLLAVLVAGAIGRVQDGEAAAAPVPALVSAVEAFVQLPEAERVALVERVERRLVESDHPGIRGWMRLREAALRELKVLPEVKAGFYPSGGRSYLEPGSASAQELAARFARHGADPLFIGRVRHDFATNTGVESERPLTAEDRLYNVLYGYPPDVDRVVAWFEAKLDFDDHLDVFAEHFAHSYADLEGNCLESVSLYDAFASGEGIDMPDADVVPFARRVLGMANLRSVPPGADGAVIYARVHDTFLEYYRYRTFVEYLANLFFNPEAPLSYEHETLRERILYSFHLDEQDPVKILRRWVRLGSRGAFVAEIDRLTEDDPSWRWYGRDVAARINATRWAIVGEACVVLQEHGLLRE